MARLTVLGGAAAGGNLGSGCSGFLVSHQRTNICLDLGPSTFSELRKHVDYRQLDGIVISHFHLDHMHDLAAMRYDLSYSPDVPERKIPLYVHPGGIALLEQMGSAFAGEASSGFYNSVFEIHEYDPTSELEVGDFKLTFAPCRHYVPCWATRLSLSSGEGDLGYTADTGPAAHLAPFFADVDCLIAEATWLNDVEPIVSRLHMTATDAALMATEARARSLVLTHWWDVLGEANYLEKAKASYSGPIAMANPELRIDYGQSG